MVIRGGEGGFGKPGAAVIWKLSLLLAAQESTSGKLIVVRVQVHHEPRKTSLIC